MAPNGTKTDRIEAAAEREFLTIEQVQELLQVGRTFAYDLVKSGELPSYRVGRLLRVRRCDVDRWLEASRRAARSVGEGKYE
jgi:excisionase family DNA binding protein